MFLGIVVLASSLLPIATLATWADGAAGRQASSSVVELRGGDILVVWESDESGDREIFAQRYDADGYAASCKMG